MSLIDNLLLSGYRTHKLVRTGIVDYDGAARHARTVVDSFDVRTPGVETNAGSLSGGNLQKFIIGREILLRPKVLILAYPTWGVDVGAATAIRQAVIELRDGGTAVLLVSEELEELFEISDRIAVISNGRLSPARATQETSVEEVGRWMAGMFDDAAEEEAAHVA